MDGGTEDVVAVPTTFKGKRFTRLKTSHRRTIATSTIYKAGIKPKKRFNESRAYLLKARNRNHDDIYMGGKNFKVLTRYNNSTSYGLAIHLIAQSVK